MSFESTTTTSYYPFFDYDDYPYYWCCGENCDDFCYPSKDRCWDACYKQMRDYSGSHMILTYDFSESVASYMLILTIVAVVCTLVMVYMMVHSAYHFGWCLNRCYVDMPLCKYRFCFWCPAVLDYTPQKVRAVAKEKAGSATTGTRTDTATRSAAPVSSTSMDIDETGIELELMSPTQIVAQQKDS